MAQAFTALGLALSIAIYIIIDGANPFAGSARTRAHVMALAPEGWGFFTRDPREDRVYIWEVRSDGQLVSANMADARGFAIAGVSRSARLRGPELAALIDQAPEHAWRPCRGAVLPCVEATWLSIRNEARVQSLCGHFVIEKRPPVPWAWSRGAPVAMPARVLALDVACDEIGAAS